jgi:hypothetical protein
LLFDKQQILSLISDPSQVAQAAQQLPDVVDHEEHGGLLQQLGIDPSQLLGGGASAADHRAMAPAPARTTALVAPRTRALAGSPGALRARRQSNRAADARAAEPAIAIRVLGEVLLVVILGVVERPHRRDLGRDLAMPGGA